MSMAELSAALGASAAEPSAAEPSAAGASQPALVCPTCGASQVPADVCRRCQSDLRMVLGVRQQYEQLRRRCLALLSTRRLKRATAVAHRCLELSRDEASARLLATCYLLQGNFAAAMQVYAEYRTHDK